MSQSGDGAVRCRRVVLLVALIGFSAGLALGLGPAAASGSPVFSTYFGGSGSDVALGSAVDAQGNFYVTGSTASRDLQTTAGVAQRVYGGGSSDAFVAKFDPSGRLVYSTFLGGSGMDEARGIAVDPAGNVYVDGLTQSADFPTRNAPSPLLNGAQDGFLVKLDPTGAMLFSTFWGGSGTDSALGLALDSSGAAYLTGETDSPDFPTTAGAFSRTESGGVDAYVTKFSSAGQPVYSTFLGGPGFDDGLAIAVDSAGQAFVTGKASAGFPVTAGAFDTTQNGGYDMFVTKLNAAGTSLAYSTYLGGSGWDEGLGVAVDAGGYAYVTGNVQSRNFPTTPNAYQTALSGSVDAVVTKLNPSGTGLIYSTFLGGTAWTEGDGLALDASGNAYIAGHLGSLDFPTTADSSQAAYGGNVDGFLAKVSPSGSDLLYSSYLGGSDWDGAMTFALGSDGNAYLSGATASADFPITPGAYQQRLSGAFDVFATKISTSSGTPSSEPDFQLAATPTSQNVVVGDQATYTVNIVIQDGWAYHVDLSVSGLPADSTASFSPPATESSSTLVVQTASTTPPGDYQLTITGTSQGRQRTAAVTLNVHCCLG